MTSVPATQRAWFAIKAGQAKDVVKLNPDTPVPIPGTGEVLVRVHSVSMNPVGYKLLRVGWPVHKFPSLVEHDFSGVVAGLGGDVKEYGVGDDILGSVNIKDYFGSKGVMAEYITIKTEHTLPKPPTLTHDESAGLPIIGQTAYYALVHRGLAKKGEQIFINGGSTGVGIVAIQMAKMMGARVVTSCSGKNVEFVKALGADQVLDYTASPIEKQLASVQPSTSVLDCVGYTSLYKASPSFLAPGGTFASLYVEPGPNASMGALLKANAGALWSRRPVMAGGVERKFEMIVGEWRKEWMSEMLQWMQDGKVKIPIDSVHRADEAGVMAAYERSLSGRATGKIIVRMI